MTAAAAAVCQPAAAETVPARAREQGPEREPALARVSVRSRSAVVTSRHRPLHRNH